MTTTTGILDDAETARAAQRAVQAPFRLEGEVALVTGCMGRLGRIWTQVLADAGAAVVVGTDTEEAKRDGSPFKGIEGGHADLTDPVSVTRLLRQFRGLYGPPTILVNNAGVDSRPSMTDYDVMTEAMVQVNLRGTDLLTRLVGQDMVQAGYGSIINIASLYGLVSPDLRYYNHRADGWVKDPMYGATKAGIISLTRYYAAKWAAQGVRVNALAPGGVVADGDGLTAQDPAFAAKYTDRIPMGRMCRPSDLAGPLVFLASQASAFVTGQTLALDGGYLCW